MRILSLIPSGTEILHALGLGEYQVGRSHECDFPASVRTLPACTGVAIPIEGNSLEIDRMVRERARQALSIYHVFAAEIAALKPTHVITQTQCDVCAVSLDDVHTALRNEFATDAKIVALTAADVAGVWQDIETVAAACGIEQRGAALIRELRTAMSDIERVAGSATDSPRIACLEWLDPLMSAGNWVPELVESAHATCLFAQSGLHSPYMTWEELACADPDIVVALPCGFGIDRTRADMQRFDGREDWRGLRAVRQGAVFIADGNQYMNRPGPRIVESLRIFAEICQPTLFAPTLKGFGWQELLVGC